MIPIFTEAHIIYYMYRYNTTQCEIFQQDKLYQAVLEHISVTFTILGALFPMEWLKHICELQKSTQTGKCA